MPYHDTVEIDLKLNAHDMHILLSAAQSKGIIYHKLLRQMIKNLVK